MKTVGRTRAHEIASWVFGFLLIAFLIAVFVLSPEQLPPYKHRQLGFICALVAGLFAYFFIGNNELLIRTKNPLLRIVFRSGGGASLFALVLLWWSSPYSFVGVQATLENIEKDTGRLVKEEERDTAQSLDWLSPNISAFQAYSIIHSSFKEELQNNEMIEILGSYYVCLEPPNRIFHRFPEWIFTFRHKETGKVTQYQIYDYRVNRPPIIPAKFFDKELEDSDILYFSILREAYIDVQLRRALEAQLGDQFTGNTASIHKFDIRNLPIQHISLYTQADNIEEVRDSKRFKVMGRYQALGRAFTSLPTETLKIESFIGGADFSVAHSEIETTDYLDDLVGFDFSKLKVDVEEAISIAVTNGAKGLVPEKSHSPGILRLYYKTNQGLNGIYWCLPLRLGIFVIAINAENGQLFSMQRPQEYSLVK